ncbi:hypothetical protein B5X24_HaOG215241 [Helicoverpa armigera]|nr:hypothetical protein B5X24_HaOG215241 [Helicoverpa armigera]
MISSIKKAITLQTSNANETIHVERKDGRRTCGPGSRRGDRAHTGRGGARGTRGGTGGGGAAGLLLFI